MHLANTSTAGNRILDARWTAFSETVCHAPEALKRRILAAATRTTLNDARVQLARVTFTRNRFEFDQSGEWAVITPVVADDGADDDLAAFAIDDDERRKTLLGRGFCVNLPRAAVDLRLHPQARLTVHYSVWSWLRAECEGALPVDWSEFALHAKQWRIGGLTLENDADGRKVDLELRRALKPPPLYVKREARAA